MREIRLSGSGEGAVLSRPYLIIFVETWLRVRNGSSRFDTRGGPATNALNPMPPAPTLTLLCAQRILRHTCRKLEITSQVKWRYFIDERV